MEKTQYYDVSEDTSKYIKSLWETFSLEGIKFIVIGDEKLKGLMQVNKLSSMYAWLTGSEILIKINEVIFDELGEDDARKILIEQELSRIQVDIDSGVIKVAKSDLSTTGLVVNRYGAESAVRANILLNELMNQR